MRTKFPGQDYVGDLEGGLNARRRSGIGSAKSLNQALLILEEMLGSPPFEPIFEARKRMLMPHNSG